MVGGRDAVLVIDDASLPKKGRHSVGVAPQDLSTQGRTGNGQALVSLALARREVPVLVGLRLFLPAPWTGDAALLARAQWRSVTWRSGTKGRLKARFVAVRVRVADGALRRIGGKNNQHLPGDADSDEAGRVFRFQAGQHSNMKPATVPI